MMHSNDWQVSGSIKRVLFFLVAGLDNCQQSCKRTQRREGLLLLLVDLMFLHKTPAMT